MPAETIVALATPRGTGALAIVRLSGPRARAIAGAIIHPDGRIAGLASHRCAVGSIVAAGEPLDHVVVAVFRAPHSYTGEDVVEITCHGGEYLPARILQLLQQAGARAARPGEFTERAFLNGRLDLAQAEAVAALVSARSAAAARVAMRVLSGGLRDALAPCVARLTQALALIEVELDVQEDGAPDVVAPACERTAVGDLLDGETERLGRLVGQAEAGRLIDAGIRVALIGRPNAGKSSLFNALLAHERAIVSSQPGTTRDFLEASVEWEELPITLVDTAGLWLAAGPVEEEAGRRTRQVIGGATVIVWVADAAATTPDEVERDLAALDAAERPHILAFHKWDRVSGDEWPAALRARRAGEERLPTSVVCAPGCAGLQRAVLSQARAACGEGAAAAVIGARQRGLLAGAHTALRAAAAAHSSGAGGEIVAFELRRAIDPLGEILGERIGPQVLAEIFARFCVGK